MTPQQALRPQVTGASERGEKEARAEQLRVPVWLEPKTFDFWVKQGELTVTERGEENEYAMNPYGMTFFCKR